MRYRSLILAFILAVGGIVTAHQALAAFSVTISPANKAIELERGASYHYEISITNNEPDVKEQNFSIRVAEFTYDENGKRAFIEPEEIVDPAQSLSTWIEVPSVQKILTNQKGSFPVDIKVPANARYGDHMALIYISKQEAVGDAGTPLTIQGRLASVLIIKVIGGDVVSKKTGEASDFQILVREKARNTATLIHNFRNTGDEFYYVETVAEVFDEKASSEPIKTVKIPYRVFPNVQKSVQVPVGDLGDDFGEKDYYLRVQVQEVNPKSTDKLVFGKFEESFHYYVPFREGESSPIEKEVQVMPPWVQIVKDLAPYGFGFLILLLILVRLLVRGKPAESVKKKR